MLTNVKQPLIVGISGFGGSGKTTAVELLAKKFSISDSKIVHLDNMFSVDHAYQLLYKDYDTDELDRVLSNAKIASRLTYSSHGFMGETTRFDEEMPEILLVEGVRLFTNENIALFDISIWIDCNIRIATTQGKQRDLRGGADQSHINRWDSEWVPKDLEYYTDIKPREIVSHLLKSAS